MCTLTLVSLMHTAATYADMDAFHCVYVLAPTCVCLALLCACALICCMQHVPPQTVRMCSLMQLLACRVATHILAFEGDSQVTWFEGSYSEYEQYKRQQAGGSLTPHRMKFRKLATV
jgi:hypothetical protein